MSQSFDTSGKCLTGYLATGVLLWFCGCFCVTYCEVVGHLHFTFHASVSSGNIPVALGGVLDLLSCLKTRITLCGI